MPKRRNDSDRTAGRAAGAAGFVASIGMRLWEKAAYRPVDSLALIGAFGASLVIVVNALFLQSGPHPAPFLANPTAQPQKVETRPNVAAMPTPKPAESPPAHSTGGSRTPQTVSGRHSDPIAELIASSIGSSTRVIAVQRALSDFGYGQIRPSGILDESTSAAIEKFESAHKLPVTGRLSDRLLTELSALTGRPIE